MRHAAEQRNRQRQNRHMPEPCGNHRPLRNSPLYRAIPECARCAPVFRRRRPKQRRQVAPRSSMEASPRNLQLRFNRSAGRTLGPFFSADRAARTSNLQLGFNRSASRTLQAFVSLYLVARTSSRLLPQQINRVLYPRKFHASVNYTFSQGKHTTLAPHFRRTSRGAAPLRHVRKINCARLPLLICICAPYLIAASSDRSPTDDAPV